MSLDLYNFSETTLHTSYTTGVPDIVHYKTQDQEIVPVEINIEDKKGSSGRGGSSGSSSGSSSGRTGSSSGSSSGSSNGRTGSSGSNGSAQGSQNQGYQGRNNGGNLPAAVNYGGGYRGYPAGLIYGLPAAAGIGLLAGHVYHTYSSDGSLVYSEVPTSCPSSVPEAATTGSYSGITTCLHAPTSISGAAYVTVASDSNASPLYSAIDSSSSTQNSVSTISTTANSAGNSLHNPHYTGKCLKASYIFTTLVGLGCVLTVL